MDFTTVEIESERLLIVPTDMTHVQDIFKNFTEEITKYMYPKPAEDISETEEFRKDSTALMKAGKNYQVTILKKDTGEFIGCGGIHRPDTRTPELGIWTKKSSHGNGYGKEAVTALYEWGVKNLDIDYMIYPVDKRNIPSRKIPESLGGVIKKEYDERNQSGFLLNTVEYHIYKK